MSHTHYRHFQVIKFTLVLRHLQQPKRTYRSIISLNLVLSVLDPLSLWLAFSIISLASVELTASSAKSSRLAFRRVSMAFDGLSVLCSWQLALSSSLQQTMSYAAIGSESTWRILQCLR